jgi:hypothetical protein
MTPVQFGKIQSVLQVCRGAALLTLIASAALFSGGCCKLVPWALAVDPSLTGTSDANGMLEPGETVVVAPSWHKGIGGSLFSCSKSVTETGAASSLTGPVVAEYAIGADTASYGTFGAIGPSNFRAGITRKCANCYEISVSVPETRTSSHWDASFGEHLGGLLNNSVSASKTWTLHIGDSFTDVPRSQPFYKKIETLLHHGITSGCSPTEFCPGQEISRGQLAVFVAKGLAKSAANVPTSGTVGDAPYDCSTGGVSLFTDVAPTDTFCRHIHYVASKNVDAGCEAGLFCPGDNLSRLQMASFVARALVQPGGDDAVPVTYGPDPVTQLSYSCDAASPNIHFSDVPETDPLCKTVHYLWAKGIVAGCTPADFCRGGDITRDQMAKFLVNAFRLTLYGP